MQGEHVVGLPAIKCKILPFLPVVVSFYPHELSTEVK